MNDAQHIVSHPHADARTGAVCLTIAQNWRDVLALNGWQTLDDLFALTNDRSLAKPGLPRWRERLRTVLTDASGRKIAVYVKRFRDVPLSQQIKRCMAGEPHHGTAWTEWTWLGELARAGISAAEPIAYGEAMLGCWERRSAVVMGAVEGISLERWCARHERSLPAAVAEALADLVARFHALGIAHRDLYLAHVFGAALETSAPRLSIIDLQRVVRVGRRRRWIVKDLAALNYSTPPTAARPRERLRWLKRYLHLCGKRGLRNDTEGETSGSRDAAQTEVRGPSAVRNRPRAPRLRRRDRVLMRRIVGKTEQVRRHDARRKRRLAEVQAAGTQRYEEDA